MSAHRILEASIFLVGALLISGCGKQAARIDPAKLKGFAALPEVPVARGDDAKSARIALGRMLFYDARLSRSQTISCNTCHELSKFGVDGQSTSEGYRGQRGTRNSPTVFNAAMHFAQFWDGRAADVEAQAQGPLLNPVEMAMPSERAVLAVLKSMPEYVAAFRRAYPGEKNPVTFRHAAEAIALFERGLLTPSRWDRFLKGDGAAITAEEKSGFNHFVAAGCDGCHSGTLVGGNSFQKLGVSKEYPDTSDAGRYNVTREQNDRMSFKVPSLRNVAMTAPFFHTGKVPTLEDAVKQMGEYETGKALSEAETTAIVTWLKSLTGDIDVSYIQKPELPKSTARTPRAGA
jgi:cytochrome c peroxidase